MGHKLLSWLVPSYPHNHYLLFFTSSVQALQSLMSPEYHKMIRNSAKIQSRRERKKKAEGGERGAGDKVNDDDEEEDLGDAASTARAPSVSGASFKSFNSVGSALSLSKRIHVQK